MQRQFCVLHRSLILQSSDVTFQASLLTDSIKQGMNRYIPLRTSLTLIPVWFSSDLRSLLKHKTYLHLKYNKTGLSEWGSAFKLCWQQCQEIQKNDYRAYLNSVESNLLNNPRGLEKYAHSRSGNIDRPAISLPHSLGRPEASDANALANFFARRSTILGLEATQQT